MTTKHDGKTASAESNPSPEGMGLGGAACSAGENLPTEEGFFWWRPNDQAKWRILEVIDPSISTTFLMATALDGGYLAPTTGTISFEWWPGNIPVGEWHQIYEPNTPVSHKGANNQ